MALHPERQFAVAMGTQKASSDSGRAAGGRHQPEAHLGTSNTASEAGAFCRLLCSRLPQDETTCRQLLYRHGESTHRVGASGARPRSIGFSRVRYGSMPRAGSRRASGTATLRSARGAAGARATRCGRSRWRGGCESGRPARRSAPARREAAARSAARRAWLMPTCSIPIACWLRPVVWRHRRSSRTSW